MGVEKMISQRTLLLFLPCLLSSALAVNRGSIQVEGYGEVWVISPDWANVQVDGNGFTLFGNSRMYFASYATDGFDGNAYWQIPLNNKVFSYSVDVSNVGCHCNAAAYFIDMPGNNAGGGGDWYCDANFGNSIWCLEYDTFEANKHTLAGTLHTCDGSNNNWGSCDRSGCQTNIFNLDSNAMCPETSPSTKPDTPPCQPTPQTPTLTSQEPSDPTARADPPTRQPPLTSRPSAELRDPHPRTESSEDSRPSPTSGPGKWLCSLTTPGSVEVPSSPRTTS